MTASRDAHSESRPPRLERQATKTREEEWKHISASAVGIEMAIAILIGVLAGNWLDGRLETEPLFALLGAAVGLAAAFKGLIRVARQHQRDMRRKQSASRGEAPDPDDASRAA